MNRPLFRILLMEDDAGDAEIIREAFRDARADLAIDHVPDGEKGMSYLRREGGYAGAGRPDLILLDLNMPLKDGREVLSELKNDAGLRAIPVLVLSTSDADRDIAVSYGLGANCYLKKPLEFDDFTEVIKSVEHFWLNMARLPPGEDAIWGRV